MGLTYVKRRAVERNSRGPLFYGCAGHIDGPALREHGWTKCPVLDKWWTMGANWA
jgi:hypothetical protein